jgi:hypothetical protein
MNCPDPGHADSPADYCAGCARACEAELTALNDRYMRLLNGQTDQRRRTAAAARREAQDHMRTFASLSLGAIMDSLTYPLRPALYRATQIDPSRARTVRERSQLEQLRNAATVALKAWDERTSRDRLAADMAARPDEAEITRLRNLITATGRRWHRYVDVPAGEVCGCDGCELIRDMDTA